ncbi:MAG: leucine-rich repeat protein [Methanomassiliicoccales archaeon]|nr:leucine-rich repeat protein [Methanomassiliicoccales archaeon]
MTAPTSVGTDWIYLAGIIAPFDLRGYAYYGSDFPGPGDLWNGLAMGSYLPADYTFTISPNFGDNSVTITGYIGSDTVITIPSEIAGFPVTVLHSLGESDDITSVTVPDSVTTFDPYAMYHSSALTTVNIGSGLTALGFEPFMMCRALTAVNISPSNPNLASLDGVVYSKDMSELIFYPYGISGGFVIPNGVQIIRDRAFYTCTLTSITIPDTVTFIGNSSFEACMVLASVTIPDSVTFLGSAAFQNCRLLTSVVIGDNVPAILANTFWYCSSLGSLTIGNNVTYIGNYAFQNNFFLTSLTIPDSVTEIGNDAFDWCYRLYDVTIGSGITRIGSCAFEDCYQLFSITFLGLNPPVVGTRWADDAGRDHGGAKGHAYLGSNFPAPGGSLGGLIMGSYIPFDYTFIFAYGQVGITGYTGSGGAITIPGEIGGYPVTAIGNSAFYGCSTLTSVIIPDSVTTIGNQAFGSCLSLTSVTIGSGVTSFGMNAFAYCSALTSVTISDGVTTIGNSAFYGCSALTSVIIPGSVITIQGQAFGECSALSSVVLGNGITTISIAAFVECTSLTSVAIPSSVTVISSFVFGGCSALTAIDVHPDNPNFASVGGVLYSKDLTVLIQYPGGLTGPFVIPDGVVRIGDYGFYGCSGLTSIIIPDSVTTIGAYAFRDCESIASVTIPYSVTTIGTWGFGECVNLTSINFQGFIAPTTVGSNWITWSNSSILGHAYPESNFPAPGGSFYGLTMGSYLLNDYTYTFDGSQVTITGYTGSGGAIIIPDEIGGYPVTIIGDRSFQNNANITSLTIPSSVDLIGEWAFDSCTALISVEIVGSGSTIVGSFAFQRSSVESVTIGNGVMSLEERAFAVCSHLTSVIIEEGLVNIGCAAFYASTLVSIDLPSTVMTISSNEDDFRAMGVFSQCYELTAINVDEDNPAFTSLDGVLYDKSMSKLLVYPLGRPNVSFTVPETVTTIENCSFYLSLHLVSLTIPGNVLAINYSAFSFSAALESVVIENGLTNIGEYAFSSCYELTSVTLPDSLLFIGESAFRECRSLEHIEFPGDLAIIGRSAFYTCPLTSVDIPDSVQIMDGAFPACAQLTTVNIGSGVTSLAGAFTGCNALVAITVDVDNPYFATIDGILYNKTITELIKYPSARSNTSFSMPNTVTVIDSNALVGCANLLYLNLSDDLESIEGRSISCPYITSLTIPSGVTHIGVRAFSGCTSLQNVNFLGMTPPIGDLTELGYYLMLGTPSTARGHAYYASDFPAPGEYFGGLLMGAYLADVTFSQTGVDTSNAGIVLTVDGTTYTASQLPLTLAWYSGSMHSFEWSGTVGIDSVTRFGWQSSSGLCTDISGTVTVPDIGGSISAVYVTQHKVSFIANGLDSDAGTSTVLTVGTTDYVWNALPSNIWINEGTTFSWAATVSAMGGRVFTLIGHSGLASPIIASGTDTADYFKSLTASGIKFFDANGNGYQDTGEPGLQYWAISIQRDSSPYLGPILTDANGYYEFTVKDPGYYTITEEVKNWWVQTCPVGDTHSFTAISGHDETDLDFGNWLGDQAMVTTSELCVFDVDGDTSNGRQFKLIFTPDVPDNPSQYRLTASNPGQFYFNVFFVGCVGEGDQFTLNIPFPFVTQGAEPVHAYSSLNTDPYGCLVPGTDVSSLFNISPTSISWMYDGSDVFREYAQITLTASDEYCGFLYINLHLDYGLKKNIGSLSPTFDNDATGTQLIIEQGYQYGFSVQGPGSFSADDEVMNSNVFKRDPGFGGLVLDVDGDPIAGAEVEIWRDDTLIGTALTDEDGWFMYEYKHTGKPTTFTLKLFIDGELTREESVTVKANSFSLVIFDLGAAPSEPAPPEDSPPTKPPKPPKK